MNLPGSEPREAVEDEARRARQSQRVADLTCALLSHAPQLGLGEALLHMAEARRVVLGLLPGQDETFDLLYRPRFLRILMERFGISEDEIQRIR